MKSERAEKIRSKITKAEESLIRNTADKIVENEDLGRVSFDYDDTLNDSETISGLAKSLVWLGYEVWIVTTRVTAKYGQGKWEQEVYNFAKEIGIEKEHIHFTNGADKWHFIKGMDFKFHLDDDKEEIDMINKNTKTRGICHWNNNEWLEKCIKAL